nr:zinc finger protein 91-like [Neodiprion pinetum]
MDVTVVALTCITKSHNHIRKAVKEWLASEETNGEYQQQLLKNSQSNCEHTLTDCHRIMPSKNTLESSGILQKVPMRRGIKMRRTFKRRRLASIKDSNEIEGPTLRSCNVSTEEDAAGLLSRVKDETNVTNSKLSIKNSNKSYSEDIKPRGVLYKQLTDGNYTCDICHSTFEQKSKIMRHITSKHSFHRPFKCSICSKAFKYKCDLKAHKLIHETIDSSMLHRCDKCDYGTKTKNNLKSHYIRKHTDDYKFSCEHCGKRFKMEWDLKFHVGTHGSSQHMCDICGRFYTSSYSLYKHRKVAHLNDYKYQCNVCNKRLLTQENLDNHMLQHSQTYTCKECAKVFASKRSRERAGLRIIKTDSDGRFILGKDSVPIELRQRSNAEGKTSYSLVPVIGNTARISGNSKFELMTDTNEVTVDANLTETVPKPTSEESKYLQQSLAHLCQITMESYACEKCGIKFPVEHMLKRHKISHKRRVTHLKVLSNVIQTTHTCPSCNVKFLKKDNLNTHMRIHRVKEKSVVYLCSLCSFKCYERTTLSSHVTRKHKTQGYATHRERYQCTTCDYKCSKKDNLNAHMWRHRDGQSNSILSCKMCGFKSFKRSTLSSHVTRKHKRKREEKTMSAMMEEYCCNTCAYKTCKKENLQAHVLGHKEVVDEGPSLSCNSCEFKCEKGVPLASYVVDKHKAAEEFRCDVCDFKCFKKSTMYSHKRRHRADSDGKIYNCNECKFKTTKKTSLYSHIKRKHKVLTKNDAGMEQVTEYFYCNQCEYKNKNKYELKVHVARKHTDDFKFSCETCGKKFKVKGDLTNHIRFNHKEGPVICDVCGKTCLNSNSLYVHQKFAHYKAKYECHICKRRLVTQENLNEHMLRQHEKRENVVCEECGKTFSRNSRLKVHMRIHTGDKPYTCNVCGKSFARRTALKQHLLIHTGIRPYVCDICGKSFTQKPGLISHRKSHPGIHPPLPRVLIDHILNDVMNN